MTAKRSWLIQHQVPNAAEKERIPNLDDTSLRLVLLAFRNELQSLFQTEPAALADLILDTRRALQDYRDKRLAEYTKMFERIINPMQDVFTNITRSVSTLTTNIVAINQAFSRLYSSDFIGKITELAQTIAKAGQEASRHFPDNWPPGKLKECIALCESGMPIVFIPRAELVSKLAAIKDTAAQKRFLLKHDKEIIDECRQKIAQVTILPKDFQAHSTASLDAYESGNYRAAQSTACVTLDALLPLLLDMRQAYKTNKGKLAERQVRELSQKLATDLMRKPLTADTTLYAIACFPLLAGALDSFQIGDRQSYKKHFNRHMTTHTVNHMQYKQSNALIALMTVTSLCIVTDKLGKYWLTRAFKRYGLL